VPVTVDQRLIEIDWGAWEGRSTGTLAQEEVDRWKADEGTAPEGESLDALSRRVEAFCVEQLEHDGVVVAVSHVSPIKAAAAWAMGVDGQVAWRMFLGLASITRVGRGKTNPVLLSFNESGHLNVEEARDR
jgi:broad specificity phosphatase PhoE